MEDLFYYLTTSQISEFLQLDTGPSLRGESITMLTPMPAGGPQTL